MHEIDIAVFRFLYGFVVRNPSFDYFVNLLTDSSLLKAGPVLFAVWYLWFIRDSLTTERRGRIVSLLIAGCSAALFSVWLTRVLPIRPRPVFDPAMAGEFAVPEVAETWSRISSLPSDHAALFVALGFGMLFVSRRWGWPLLLHALLFICLPRVFVGLHWIWDVVAGAAIGVTFVLICNTEVFRKRISERLASLETTHAPAFYGMMFALSFQISDLFHGSRQLLGLLTRIGGSIYRGAGSLMASLASSLFS